MNIPHFFQNQILKISSVILFSCVVLLAIMGCTPTQVSETKSSAGFISIFDGKTLNNWKGDPTYWRVEQGMLIGEVTPETLLEQNSFIIWEGGRPSDFELKLEYRISKEGNSGINYRSERLKNNEFALRGYQSDIDGKHKYTGMNYDERRRTTIARRGQKVIVHSQDDPENAESLRAGIHRNQWLHSEVIGTTGDEDTLIQALEQGEWKQCHIIAKENHLQHYVNGMLMSEVFDEDNHNRSEDGLIGVQVHVGPPMKVAFRNILLKWAE